MVLGSVDAYGEQALEAKQRGLAGYKLHTPGRNYEEDLAAHAAAREAVGPGFPLMSDPVACFNLEQAVRFGRALERLDYHWLEEPLFDEDTHALRELTRVLDIPIVGTEVIAKHPYSVAECIATRVVDRVRADVSWTGGVTGASQDCAASRGLRCELRSSHINLPPARGC